MPISILKKLIGKKASNEVPRRIYGAVVSQARNVSFFSDFAIPDTVMGRYDMLALHVFLVNRRLKYVEADTKLAAKELSQDVFDLFIIDIERGLRDLGFADTSVHKRKKRLARSYYALIEEFDDALETGESGKLIDALCLRYFDELEKSEQLKYAQKLEAYLFLAVEFLAQQSFPVFLQGKIDWPLMPVRSVES